VVSNYEGKEDLRVHLSMEYLDENSLYAYRVFDLKIKPYDLNILVEGFKKWQ